MSNNKIMGSPEIIIALAGGVGTDIDKIRDYLVEKLKNINYDSSVINLTELINYTLGENSAFSFKTNRPKDERINDKMDQCTKLRQETQRNDILCLMAIVKIVLERPQLNNEAQRKVYIIDSLKRPEEFKLLRQVYGRNFILLSIYSPRNNRIKFLGQKIEEDEIIYGKQSINNSEIDNQNSEHNCLTSRAINLVCKDENEIDPTNRRYGQNLRNTFPLGHYFIRVDQDLNASIDRFLEIMFGHPYRTPTKDELNMFIAKGISLRSADPSRQVGAVICNDKGAIISTGCNDVPKFGGGLYWETDQPDNRDFRKEFDSNFKFKSDIIKEIIRESIIHHFKNDKIQPDEINNIFNELKDSKVKGFDALEYGRAVHAEEAAICDAAMRGVSVKDCTLYCTTFSCHLCAKHIIAAGIKKVIYIDPYPKSLAEILFEDEIQINSDCQHNDKVLFEPFIGVAPKRFLHVFKFKNSERESENDNKKIIKKFNFNNKIKPRLSTHRSYLSYCSRELMFLRLLKNKLALLKNNQIIIVDNAITKIMDILKKLSRSHKDCKFLFDMEIETDKEEIDNTKRDQ